MTRIATLLEVRAGKVREHARPDWDRHANRLWKSAYVKDPLAGEARVTPLGIEGDEQYSRDVHGGEHMALLAYSAAHYADWREALSLPAMGPGGFGENLVLDGADETEVCIGDVWSAGGVRLQVSQPRGPCANISRRWNREDLVQRVTANGRTGWYLRVLAPGAIAAGQGIDLVERPHARWTVARVFRARVEPKTPRETLAAIAGLAALSPEWRAKFSARLAG